MPKLGRETCDHPIKTCLVRSQNNIGRTRNRKLHDHTHHVDNASCKIEAEIMLKVISNKNLVSKLMDCGDPHNAWVFYSNH